MLGDLVDTGLLLLPQLLLEVILVVDSRANRLWKPSIWITGSGGPAPSEKVTIVSGEVIVFLIF